MAGQFRVCVYKRAACPQSVSVVVCRYSTKPTSRCTFDSCFGRVSSNRMDGGGRVTPPDSSSAVRRRERSGLQGNEAYGTCKSAVHARDVTQQQWVGGRGAGGQRTWQQHETAGGGVQ